MKAGRMDIACHVIINSFFLSHKKRDDVILHLVFYGPPDPPKHIILNPKKYLPETGKEVGSLDLSKKDVSGLLKRILYRYKKGEKREAFPGCWIEKKSLFDVLEELEKEGKKIYILDENGEDIRNFSKEDLENSAFLLGDCKGLPKKELRRLKKKFKLISVGKKIYFASQVVTIVNNELDRREI